MVSSWSAHRHGGLVVLLGELGLPVLAHGLAPSDHHVDLHLTAPVAHLGCLHSCTLDFVLAFHPSEMCAFCLSFIIPAPISHLFGRLIVMDSCAHASVSSLFVCLYFRPSQNRFLRLAACAFVHYFRSFIGW